MILYKSSHNPLLPDTIDKGYLILIAILSVISHDPHPRTPARPVPMTIRCYIVNMAIYLGSNHCFNNKAVYSTSNHGRY